MATLSKPSGNSKPTGFLKARDFRKVMEVCKSPPRASANLKARMAAAKAIVKR